MNSSVENVMVTSMFTGIIKQLGHIKSKDSLGQSGVRLQIQHSGIPLKLGESLSVDGVCVTVTPLTPTLVSCDLSPETLLCTILGCLEVGSMVNLEQSLSTSDRLGGHFVTGHVDQIGKVRLLQQQEHFIQMELGGVRSSNRSYLHTKGSVAVNGVSLTVNMCRQDTFNVMLIPSTLTQTNLKSLRVGSPVNLEFDCLAKMVARQLQTSLLASPCHATG